MLLFQPKGILTLFFSLSIQLLTAQLVQHIETEFDDVGGVSGLENGYGVIVSPDGDHVYTTGSGDDAVAVFSRDAATGEITYITQYVDDSQGGAINHLLNPRRMKMSSDGQHFYVASNGDDAIVLFSRDAATGLLTFIESYQDGVLGVDGLNGANDIEFNADETIVYASSTVEDAVAVFSRDPVTGRLLLMQVMRDGVGGVDGLNGASGMAISPDNQFLYVAGSIDDGISIFAIDPGTGMLVYQGVILNGVGGVVGLNGVNDVIVSQDNAHLYSTALSDDAIAYFERDPGSGMINLNNLYLDDSQGGSITNLNAPRSLIFDLTNDYVYAVSSSDDALLAFQRDPGSGELFFNAEAIDGFAGTDGLDGARALAISPDGNNIYTVSTGDDALSAFGSPVLLPIELLSFKGTPLNNGTIVLDWETALETNNDFFEIERQTKDGSFEVIGTINSTANDFGGSIYSFSDGNPLTGTNYYRLKQVDEDGEFTNSEIIAISASSNINISSTFTVYPNPASDYISWNSTESVATAQVQLFDATGRMVYSNSNFNQSNNNKLNLQQLSLQKGMYIIQVTYSNSSIKTDKFLIQ